MSKENKLHWSEEKEAVSSSKPLKLLFILFLHLPQIVILSLIYPIGFFYLLFSKRARCEARNYQKQLCAFLKESGKSKIRISPYTQIVSFCLCVAEKMMGWLGKVQYNELITHNDDLQELIDQLEQKKGAIIIGSHLGNIDLLRSLSSFNRTGVNREIEVTIIMEVSTSEQFTKTLKEINPKYTANIISPENITPETAILLQEKLDSGGLLVYTGDRTSARNRTRIFREKFLGKNADFPYGVFMMPAILHAPTYFMFALRTKNATLHPKYNMFIEKSKTNFNCTRNERNIKIHELALEFVKKLEKYCIEFPYQWYNFYNFWLLQETETPHKNALDTERT
ncbi:MAG: hypothetical protein HDR51_03140 [Treponema sp.]|nr:hypothetical protein [Treponema sp.]MDE6244443.1 hypothetical protein [Treponemataceae bacterium]MDE7383049.1 hypothetical protein [Treponemataceae bacterium]